MLRLALRALVLLLSIHVSGIAGAALELTASADESGDCCSECPLEKTGKECPPSCPACHCSHGGVALPPAAVARPVDAFDPDVSVADARPDDVEPRAPQMPGVYRPPRFATT